MEPNFGQIINKKPPSGDGYQNLQFGGDNQQATRSFVCGIKWKRDGESRRPESTKNVTRKPMQKCEI